MTNIAFISSVEFWLYSHVMLNSVEREEHIDILQLHANVTLLRSIKMAIFCHIFTSNILSVTSEMIGLLSFTIIYAFPRPNEFPAIHLMLISLFVFNRPTVELEKPGNSSRKLYNTSTSDGLNQHFRSETKGGLECAYA